MFFSKMYDLEAKRVASKNYVTKLDNGCFSLTINKKKHCLEKSWKANEKY